MHRDDFSMLTTDDIVYFDNGATTLKPNCVVAAVVDYYTKHTSNIHRGEYDAAIITNQLYDATRQVVRDFVHCFSSSEVVFTSGTTQSINMVVFGYMRKHLHSGDEVLITKAEHASNVIAWYRLREEMGIVVNYIPLDDTHELSIENLKKSITDKTKVISLAHVTNVIGDVRDIETIGQLCFDKKILFHVDGAQSVPHMPVDFKKCHIDFLSFSGHKMLGPTGVGVLVARGELLEEMDPICYGGGMNQSFETDGSYELKEAPIRFEAGTPPIAQVIGLKRAIEYLTFIGMDNIHNHEVELKRYLVSQLENIPNIVIYNKHSASGILAFNIRGVFSQETAIYLNQYHIYVRAGNHCAKILKDDIDIKNTVRISMYLYNTKEDIDRLILALQKSENIFRVIE